METLSQLADRILDRAKIDAGAVVLDVGTGTGLLGRAAESRGARVVSFDLDAKALAMAPGMRVVGDVRRAPFDDAVFGRAVMRSLLVWMHDRSSALSELFRVLKPGAIVAGSESLNAHLELRVQDPDLLELWAVFQEALLSLEGTLSEAALRESIGSGGFVDLELDVDEEVETDPYEIIMQLRPPGGFTIAEYLVAGGIDIAVVEGFADGVRRKGGSFVSSHALFTAHRP